ncbi:MAG TPA: ThuA domain-containing protein, partial [Flavitalea sp.]|nr:ThuA domain-containing protein [Flavitalea sp.]
MSKYNAVVFLSTTMNVLNADQQIAFEHYIQAGGGFAGIHAAADTEYDWPWYNQLVGAYFLSHPHQQNAKVNITDKTHPSTAKLPDTWERFDEWYNYKNIYSGIKVLATLDESSYEGGANGDNHPIAWYHDYDGGKAFYTGMGHTKESYEDPKYLQHILGGIQSVMANGFLDYAKAYSVKSPEDNRFTKTVLSNDLNEPMELTIAPDGRVFFTERAGKFYMYDPASNSTKLLRDFPAKAVDKYLNGLIGITLDPDFATNNFIYFFYSSSTGDSLHQNISRFVLKGNELDTTSEKVIIKVPIDAEVSAHTGGSLAWDKNKNLYISTGDNTVPFESEGYAPIDERKGRLVYDAQRSAGNANDLRGKILRIHPEADGSYTIPEGNLFPKGTAGTRPEIYVMGCRNPYRMSVDMETSIVYWGEVGPDAGEDSKHGPRGYDEFNQAKKPGNYGWPYFVGNNKAYNDSDFATKAIGALYNEKAPVNTSPNNTGIQNLPPATPAMIWYPYAGSKEFPVLGNGGRCAMGGPVYHYNASLKNANRLPDYYDKALFVYDWMRNWVFAVRLDEQQNFKRMEPFMSTNGDFRRPIDIEIAPDGVMYMLEYGSVYGIDNEDARLVRIDYNSGNRAPAATITTNDTIGTAPFKVALDGAKSKDLDDDDELKYEWIVDGKSISKEQKTEYSFDKNGVYKVILKVEDPSGLSSTDTTEIKVGNTLPSVSFSSTSNRSFYFSGPTDIQYKVNVSDKEDKSIDTSKIKLTMNFIPKLKTSASSLIGHQKIDETYNLGKELIAASDCKACHQVDATSVGPSFTAVSQKYADDKTAVSRLANKII